MEKGLQIHPYINITSHLNSRDNRPHLHFSSVITYLRLVTVLLLRSGYVLIQLGSVPVDDVYTIILQNFLDITVALAAYGIIGYMFSFGQDSLGGFLGTNSWLYSGYTNLDEIIFGFTTCLIGTAIITTMLAGRIMPLSAAGTTFVYAGLFQPIIMHWVWHEKGLMTQSKILSVRVSIKDHAGAIPIHLSSGMVALWGTMCLGRRLVKLKEVHESSIGSESPGTTFVGYTFVMLGLLTFSLPTQKYEMNRIPDDFLGLILVNSILALSSGFLVVLLQCCCFGNTSGYWILLKCLQGSIASLVTISAGVDVYNHIFAGMVGGIGVIVFYVTTIVLERMFYEDYSNIIPIHVMCALVGALCPALLGSKENLGYTVPPLYRVMHLLWQLTCCFVVIIWITVFFLPLFVVLQFIGLLRNRSEELNHQRSINTCKHIGRNRGVWRIFSSAENDPIVEPGTEIRSRASLDKTIKEQHEARRVSLLEFERTRNKKVGKKTFILPMPPPEPEPVNFDDLLYEKHRHEPKHLAAVGSSRPRNLASVVSKREAGDVGTQSDIIGESNKHLGTLTEVDVHENRKGVLKTPDRAPETSRTIEKARDDPHKTQPLVSPRKKKKKTRKRATNYDNDLSKNKKPN